MAPGANIMLVETPVPKPRASGFPQIVEAENYVIDHHLGDVISQSFGATEQTFSRTTAVYRLRSAYFNALVHRVTVLAASGDAGADRPYRVHASDFYPFRVDAGPPSDPLVTSVGGTQLHLDATATAPRRTTHGTMASCFGGPSQRRVVVVCRCLRPSVLPGRRQPNMSAAARHPGREHERGRQRRQPGVLELRRIAAGLASTPGYHIIGGTSEASPLFAGIVAVADQAAGHDLGLLNPALYHVGDGSGSGLRDITAGDTTATFTNPSADPIPAHTPCRAMTPCPATTWPPAWAPLTANGSLLSWRTIGRGSARCAEHRRDVAPGAPVPAQPPGGPPRSRPPAGAPAPSEAGDVLPSTTRDRRGVRAGAADARKQGDVAASPCSVIAGAEASR